MDKPISVGDLVYVAFPCPSCGSLDDIGITFKVGDFWESDSPYECCGLRENTVNASAQVRKYPGYPVQTLRRIPPLSELEGQKRDEKLTEPA